MPGTDSPPGRKVAAGPQPTGHEQTALIENRNSGGHQFSSLHWAGKLFLPVLSVPASMHACERSSLTALGDWKLCWLGLGGRGQEARRTLAEQVNRVLCHQPPLVPIVGRAILGP